MAIFSFPKESRLLSSMHFECVFRDAKQVSSREIIIFGRLNELEYPRIGLVIAKKNIKPAHERNRIKRVIREYFRLHQYDLPLMDFVILVKKEIINLNNQEITQKLEKLWHYYYCFVQDY